MTSTPTRTDPWAGIACPSWCTKTHVERPPAFEGDDVNLTRYHGARIGEGVRGEATEDVRAPGVLTYSVELFGDVDIYTPEELLELGSDCLDGAKWLVEVNR